MEYMIYNKLRILMWPMKHTEAGLLNIFIYIHNVILLCIRVIHKFIGISIFISLKESTLCLVVSDLFLYIQRHTFCISKKSIKLPQYFFTNERKLMVNPATSWIDFYWLYPHLCSVWFDMFSKIPST